jgi:hypothetical protein
LFGEAEESGDGASRSGGLPQGLGPSSGGGAKEYVSSGMRRVWARLRVWLRHPAAAVVLVVLLGVSVWSLPAGVRDGTMAGWAREGAFDLVSGAFVTRDYFPLSVYVARGPGGLRLIDENTESWDELSRLVTARPGDVVMVMRHIDRGRRGVYAPTRWVEGVRIEVVALGVGGRWPAEEIAEARQLFVDWMDEQLAPEKRVAGLREADYRRSTLLWAGYVHDLVALAAALALLYSLRWNLSPAVWRARRWAWWVGRGECLGCGFAFVGLADRKGPVWGVGWGDGEGRA